jgi:hypothetical protein
MRRLLTPLTVAIPALLLVLPANGSAEPVRVRAIGIQLHASNSVYVTGTEDVDRVTASKLDSNAWQVTAPGGVIAETECAGGIVSPYQTCGCMNVDAVTANCTSPNRAAVIAQLFGGSDSVRADEHVALWAVSGKGHDRLMGADSQITSGVMREGTAWWAGAGSTASTEDRDTTPSSEVAGTTSWTRRTRIEIGSSTAGPDKTASTSIPSSIRQGELRSRSFSRNGVNDVRARGCRPR